ncbi:MAG: ABC transporter ATP-binding protein [Actinomycetota bacterium]
MSRTSTVEDRSRAETDRSLVAASARGLSKVYGEGNTRVVALDAVDVEFAAARLTAIMGPSGSGKSTLLHCMAGLDRPTDGVVRIGATEIGTLKDRDLTLLRRRRMGFVFQSFNLVPTLTARENILLPILLGGEEPETDWLDTIAETFDLGERLHHRPSELSGGQQQRVAVARALMSRPDIIFADEPTGNLDSASGTEVLEFLRRAVDEWRQTVVMVTHDARAASYADLVVFLRDGQIVDQLEAPTSESVLDRLRELEA